MTYPPMVVTVYRYDLRLGNRYCKWDWLLKVTSTEDEEVERDIFNLQAMLNKN